MHMTKVFPSPLEFPLQSPKHYLSYIVSGQAVSPHRPVFLRTRRRSDRQSTRRETRGLPQFPSR